MKSVRDPTMVSSTPKTHSRKSKNIKAKEEIATGIQSNLEKKFQSVKRVTRRTKCPLVEG